VIELAWNWFSSLNQALWPGRHGDFRKKSMFILISGGFVLSPVKELWGSRSKARVLRKTENTFQLKSANAH